MIGAARRECMDFAGHSLHFLVCSTAANEYYGPWRHLAIRYAHLDLVVHEVRNLTAFEGVLPELWGLRPMSDEAINYMRLHQDTVGHTASEPTDGGRGKGGNDSIPLSLEENWTLPKGAAWAG